MTPESFKARNHALKPLSTIGKVLWVYNVFGKFDIWDLLPYSWQRYWYDQIKPIFKPKNTRLRKVIPRTWMDISSLIETVNFEFVKKFYEEEYVNGIVDWEQSGEHHIEFARWLEATYQYITIERPKLEKDLDDAYPPLPSFDEWLVPNEYNENGSIKNYTVADRGKSYEELYGEVNRIEQLIVDRDTEVLTEIVKRRQYFWT
jgi:hypothetical protein